MNAKRGQDPKRLKIPGQRIREICEALEKFGPMKAAEIHQHLDHISAQNCGEYCAIGVFDGYLKVKKSAKKTGPSVWTAKPNWRELMEEHATLKPSPAPAASRWTGVVSVFQIGGAA